MHETINYLELPCRDFKKTREFFSGVFDWQFQEYGDEYLAFFTSTISGGFYKSKLASTTDSGATLIVFYSKDLAATEHKIELHGGSIIKPTFSFPGGRRFHFTEPSGNEFAVWSDK